MLFALCNYLFFCLNMEPPVVLPVVVTRNQDIAAFRAIQKLPDGVPEKPGFTVNSFKSDNNWSSSCLCAQTCTGMCEMAANSSYYVCLTACDEKDSISIVNGVKNDSFLFNIFSMVDQFNFKSFQLCEFSVFPSKTQNRKPPSPAQRGSWRNARPGGAWGPLAWPLFLS